MRAPAMVWWSPFAQWERWKAAREATKAVRKAIDVEKDRRAEELLRYRQNLVRVVKVQQGRWEVFEVQYRFVADAPWLLASKSYGQESANYNAERVAERLWNLAQPRKVQVVG